MLGLCLSLPEAARRIPGAAAPLPAAFSTIVIQGDSITSGMPGTPNGFYSYQYGDYRADKTIEVRAQGSRAVGAPAELNDDGNTLMGNVAEDVAYGPQLITAMIGTNDFTLGTDATYRGNLIGYFAALKAASPGVKFAWAGPIAPNPTGAPPPQKANIDAQRATLFASGSTGARNPAVWGQWADFYLPMGEYPDFGDAALAAPLFGDSVHPSTAGQALLYNSYKAAMDTLLDANRASSTAPYNAVWPSSETNLPTGEEVVRRFIVSGLAHTGTALGVSVSGGGAQIRVNGGSYGASRGTGSGNCYRLYNGDVIDLKLTTSASNSTAVSIDLTIGSETRTITYATVAEVTPAAVAYGGTDGVVTPGTSITYAGKLFEEGVALIALATGLASPTGGVSVGGDPATLIRRDGQLELWRCPVVAGAHDVVIDRPSGFVARHAVQWLTLTNAGPLPTASGGDGGTHHAPPFGTPALTVPAGGVLVGVLHIDTGETEPTISAGAGDVMLGQGTTLY